MRLLPAIALCLTLVTPNITPAQSVAERSASLHTLVHEILEDDLKRSPEFASAIGDLRYNDQLSDLSPRAFNEAIAGRQGFLNRLLAIDAIGLSEPDRTSAGLVLSDITQDLEAARFKPWQLPIAPSHGIQSDLAGLAATLPFANVKDYDDYIARLHLVPRQLRQASENLLAGIDDHRIQSVDIIEKAIEQTEGLAVESPEDSAFAAPLKKFPAAVPAASQKRISTELLDAIRTDVLPAYARFAKFLRVTELPAAQSAAPTAEVHSLSSTIDQLATLKLLAKAQAALGSKFDIKTFHELVVSCFALPAETLEQRVDSWIAAK